MSIVRRLLTTSGAVAGWPRRAATALMVTAAMLAAVPGTAHGEDDPITIS